MTCSWTLNSMGLMEVVHRQTEITQHCIANPFEQTRRVIYGKTLRKWTTSAKWRLLLLSLSLGESKTDSDSVGMPDVSWNGLQLRVTLNGISDIENVWMLWISRQVYQQ